MDEYSLNMHCLFFFSTSFSPLGKAPLFFSTFIKQPQTKASLTFFFQHNAIQPVCALLLQAQSEPTAPLCTVLFLQVSDSLLLYSCLSVLWLRWVHLYNLCCSILSPSSTQTHIYACNNVSSLQAAATAQWREGKKATKEEK